jgi:hypothetical protein
MGRNGGIDSGLCPRPFGRAPLHRMRTKVLRILSILHPRCEHILDWFHIGMRIDQLMQTARGLRSPPTGVTKEFMLKEIARVKWFLWQGNVVRADDTLSNLIDNWMGYARRTAKRGGHHNWSSRSFLAHWRNSDRIAKDRRAVGPRPFPASPRAAQRSGFSDYSARFAGRSSPAPTPIPR